MVYVNVHKRTGLTHVSCRGAEREGKRNREGEIANHREKLVLKEIGCWTRNDNVCIAKMLLLVSQELRRAERREQVK